MSHGNEPEHNVIGKYVVRVPELNMRINMTVYEPEIMDIPWGLHGEETVVIATTRMELDYESWLYDDVANHVVYRLAKALEARYDRYGFAFGDYRFDTCMEHGVVEVKVLPMNDLMLERIRREIAETIPKLTINTVVEGVKTICDRYNSKCRIDVKEELAVRRSEEDERELVTA